MRKRSLAARTARRPRQPQLRPPTMVFPPGNGSPERKEQVVEQTVFVTGSLIPQRIKVHRVGTKTVSPLRMIDRWEIDATGRWTTAGAFVNDPSVRIIGH